MNPFGRKISLFQIVQPSRFTDVTMHTSFDEKSDVIKYLLGITKIAGSTSRRRKLKCVRRDLSQPDINRTVINIFYLCWSPAR